MTDLTRAIALNAKYAPSFVARGDVFNAKRDFGRSVADYDRAPSIARDNRYAQQMKRQAVVAKSELAGQSAISCGGNDCGTSYSNGRCGGVVPALPRIEAPKEFPDRPVKQDNDSVGGLRIRFPQILAVRTRPHRTRRGLRFVLPPQSCRTNTSPRMGRPSLRMLAGLGYRLQEGGWHLQVRRRSDHGPQSRQHRRAAGAERDLESTSLRAPPQRRNQGEPGDRKISDRSGSSANVTLAPSPKLEAVSSA
jgi:hypothetical protein